MNFLHKSKPALSSLVRTLKPPPPPALSRSLHTEAAQNLQHFRRRRSYGDGRWCLKGVVALAFASGAAAVTVYCSHLETVPYTKRTHLILYSPQVERQMGESGFRAMEKALAARILPSTHPHSVRVQRIAEEIVGALQRGLGHGERRWSGLEFSHPNETQAPCGNISIGHEGGQEGVVFGVERKEEELSEWSREDEILDDRWVRESRKAKGAGMVPATKHLEGLNGEVIVVEDSNVNAFCFPGGKIVVNTGLLEHFNDGEIATFIGHEVFSYFFIYSPAA